MPAMTLLAKCPHTIPAERCVVVMFPSILLREQMVKGAGDGFALASFDRLEEHGLDEIECGWEGRLTVTGYETPTDWYAEGECPACGQTIELRGTD